MEANLQASESSAAVAKVINIANGVSVTINELLDSLKSLTNRSEVAAEYAPARTGDVLHSLADLTLAQSALGYSPRITFEEGLHRTLDWWKKSRFAR